jgi:hypothetical protein
VVYLDETFGEVWFPPAVQDKDDEKAHAARHAATDRIRKAFEKLNLEVRPGVFVVPGQ